MSGREQLCRLGQAYYRYSVEHVQYFEIIFYELVDEKSISAGLQEKSLRAEETLRNAVKTILRENQLPVSQYNQGLGAFASWALAHGISSLAAKHVNRAACTIGAWPPEFMLSDPSSIVSSFEAMADLLVAGILHAARLQDD